MLIDLDRLDTSKPIDLVSLVNTGVYKFNPDERHFGVHLTDEGADIFKAKINIEVQWASELVIATIEKNGGTITTAYYDHHSLQAILNTKKFFERGKCTYKKFKDIFSLAFSKRIDCLGVPIPRRMIPPQDAIEYYTNPAKRGYLADPEKISEERLVLAQKYGYALPKIEDDPDYKMLTQRKDPRQIFYGLNPGWVVNLKDKVILKPQEEELLQHYAS